MLELQADGGLDGRRFVFLNTDRKKKERFLCVVEKNSYIRQ